jgi:hypothetical protein
LKLISRTLAGSKVKRSSFLAGIAVKVEQECGKAAALLPAIDMPELGGGAHIEEVRDKSWGKCTDGLTWSWTQLSQKPSLTLPF